ncbi:tetratricopeptide repeat protein [Microcoleus sp. herbarium12]|uniref:tetratricopeptide repeat protein n=1 Tax=Microcoleus sp. herbarium12 TaxID=3055437 RepID=UPI002FD183AF
MQSWQQALIIDREIKNRHSEGKALGNLGLAYRNLGDCAKAIDYAQQWLATHGLFDEVKTRDFPGAIALTLSGNDD